MSNELYIESLLDDFIKKRMDREETAIRLQKQAVDDVPAEISLHVASAAALQRHAILLQVKNVHREFTAAGQSNDRSGTPSRIVKRMPLRLLLRVAAAVLLVFSAWLAYEYVGTSGQSLYREMYQPYYLDTERGIGEVPRHDMLERFKEGAYEAVIRTFDRLEVSSNREKFLAAYALQATGNFPRSAELLRELIANNNETNAVLYQDEAEFYLGLAYLRMNDHAAAKAVFDEIRNDPNHTFHDKVSRWTMTRMKWLW